MILQIQHPDGHIEERAWTPDWDRLGKDAAWAAVTSGGYVCGYTEWVFYRSPRSFIDQWKNDGGDDPPFLTTDGYWIPLQSKWDRIRNWRDTLHCRRPQTWDEVPEPDWDSAPKEAQWAILNGSCQYWKFNVEPPIKYNETQQYWVSTCPSIRFQTIGDGQDRNDPEWAELVRTSLRERPKAGNKRIYPQSLVEAEARRLTKEMKMKTQITRKPSQYYCFAVDQEADVDYARIVRENADAQAVVVAKGNRAIVLFPQARQENTFRLDNRELKSTYVQDRGLWCLEELQRNKHGFLAWTTWWSPRVARRLARLYAEKQERRVVRVNAYGEGE